MKMNGVVNNQHFSPRFPCDVRRAGVFPVLDAVRAEVNPDFRHLYDYQCYNGSIQQILDSRYRHELDNFHSDMIHCVSVGPSASYWERC